MKGLIFSLCLLAAVGSLVAQETFPQNDIDFKKVGTYAFVHATIIQNSHITLKDATLIVSKGKISAVGVNARVPADAVIFDCKGKFIYPSFIDIYSDYGMPALPRSQNRRFGGPGQMTSEAKNAVGWNAAIKAENEAAKVFQINEVKAKDLRSAGFGLVNSHIQDGIVRGTGSLVSLESESANLALIKPVSTAHFSFSKGSSTQDYPGSLMGVIALIRQTFMDAKWYKSNPPAEGTNLSLASFNQLLQYPMIIEAGDKWNDLRAAKIGQEFGVPFIIVAGGNEYQRINDIKMAGSKMIVPINFPNAQDVDDPNDARLIALADMKHWEMAPANPGSLEKAGVSFALTASGLKDAASFKSNLQKAILNGLSEAYALDALTVIPADLLGITEKTATLEVGKMANFVIASGPPFKENTTLFQNWIQGHPYDVAADGWDDHRSDYTLTINAESYKFNLGGNSPANVTAKIMDHDTTKADVKINDKLINITFSFKKDSAKLNRLSGVQIGTSWQGTGQLANGDWVKWSLTKSDKAAHQDAPKKEVQKKSAELGQVLYPFQGFGLPELPAQSDILIKNATIWTSEKEGILQNTDILIQKGTITKIGANLSSANAKIIDATGKNVTPGIIDEHSHIAAIGGINECTQSVTAEVRIADVLNPDDINIYRQLSGGVTSSHILHGSCNTIGGQTQLIKLRWGKNAEELKFENWPGFIKFALGENVKRASNAQNNRFPDTRMGVEQVLEDAFNRAIEYKNNPSARRDLELDALVEILDQKRFITCHSYVASEILDLMKVADKYHFKVNTFTHILEGYKVADIMKAHGAAASSFSDWWAYKMEVKDAIPQSPYIMNQVGLNVAINSDDAEMARRLNQEAAKSIKYAGMGEQEALKMVTINPATMLHVADRTGSIKVGKDADLVIWSDHPLSIYAKAEKTIVDGIIYFDREKDLEQQQFIATEKNRLVQKMMGAKKGGARTDRPSPSFQEEAQCEEDHQHGKGLWERIEQRLIYND